MKDLFDPIFLLIAFIVGELFSALILFPTFNEFYEPYLEYDFALRSLVWLCLFIVIPTFIGVFIEGVVKAFFGDFFSS